jgi:hypothetical protein
MSGESLIVQNPILTKSLSKPVHDHSNMSSSKNLDPIPIPSLTTVEGPDSGITSYPNSTGYCTK